MPFNRDPLERDMLYTMENTGFPEGDINLWGKIATLFQSNMLEKLREIYS